MESRPGLLVALQWFARKKWPVFLVVALIALLSAYWIQEKPPW
jgi:uncharacterized protein involved in exopolysaccharide biosynthesis